MDPLEQLKDITIPLQPEWWPPAPGWWLLLVLGIFLLVRLVQLLKRTIDKKHPFKQARMATLAHHQAFIANTIHSEEYVEQLNQLLKRVVLHAQEGSKAASLSGQKWLNYLDDISKSTGFSAGQGNALGDMRYRKNTQSELSELHTQVLRVIRVLEKSA